MILDRLHELRQRLGDDRIGEPTDHKSQSIDWYLDLSPSGGVEAIVAADGVDAMAPYRRRGGQRPPPYLFVDKAEYVFGLPVSEAREARTRARRRHAAYLKLARACGRGVDDGFVDVFMDYLRTNRDSGLQEARAQGVSPDDLILPRVDGEPLTEGPEVRRFWRARLMAEASEKSRRTMECMLCGDENPIVTTHPVELPLAGERPTLVTANEGVFESYGLEQAEIAPMCRPCAISYGEALRFLLSDDHHHVQIGGLVWVFWTRDPEAALDPAALLTAPGDRAEQVRELLASAYGTTPAPTRGTRFFALTLSANKTRLIVRSWIDTTVAEIQAHLARYFRAQTLWTGKTDKRYGLPMLARSLFPSRDGSLPAPWKLSSGDRAMLDRATTALFEAAVLGRPLPRWMLNRVVGRLRAEAGTPGATGVRTALMKLLLTYLPTTTEGRTMSDELTPGLNEDHPSPAYQCGRLLSLLENIQQVAVGSTSTIADRYYGSASAAPAVCFGHLLRNARRAHLPKLRRQEGTAGLGVYFERRIAEIAGRVGGEFPRRLTLEEQGLFGLGYFQEQRARGRAGATKEDAPATPDAA